MGSYLDTDIDPTFGYLEPFSSFISDNRSYVNQSKH